VKIEGNIGYEKGEESKEDTRRGGCSGGGEKEEPLAPQNWW
jgi:hypothetical protein